MVLPANRFDKSEEMVDLEMVDAGQFSNDVSSILSGGMKNQKFAGKSRFSKLREAKYIKRKQNQKPGPLKFYEAIIENLDVNPEVKQDFLMVTYTGWTSINYDVQSQVIKNFTSKHCRDEYLAYLITPACLKTDSVMNLSPCERL